MSYNEETIEKKRKTNTPDDLFADACKKNTLTKQEMITQVSTDSLYKQLLREYEEVSAQEAGSLGEIRRDAFSRFSAAGFPPAKKEDWKYTNIQPLISQHYFLEPSTHHLGLPASAFGIPGLDAIRLVLVNGVLRTDLSSELPENSLEIKPIQEAFDHPLFVKHFAAYADKTDNPFVSLNTALFKNGVFISIPKNQQVNRPIHIIHVGANEEALFTQVRNIFVLSANSEAEIIESFVTAEDNTRSLNNHVTEIILEENAKLQHYYLQESKDSESYVNHTEVYQAKHSLYNNYNCTFPGAAFVRNNINVRLDDIGVESHLYGITLTAADQFVDNHTIVDHLKPNCESYEWYKNITQDSSTAVFNGKIFVRQDAQKTNAFQQNNNLLMGEKSAVYTKPQLEIFADDVKCSHGCTIGQFDHDALFYLRSRGVGEDQCRILLVYAFAFDVTSRFSNEVVRDYVEKLVALGLAQTEL